MSGQSANCTRSEVISKLKMIERGPMKPMGKSDPNCTGMGMSAMIPTNNMTGKMMGKK